MIYKETNYKEPEGLVHVAKSVHEPLHMVVRIVPALAFFLGGLFILYLEVGFYNDDVYMYESNLSDYNPSFGISYLWPTILLCTMGIIIFILFYRINHYKTIGKKNENAISYNALNNSLVVRKWEYTYEFKLNNIYYLDYKECMGSKESYVTKRYDPVLKKYEYSGETYKSSIRKIIFKVKENKNSYTIDVPVWNGEAVYDVIKSNLIAMNIKCQFIK